MVHSTPVNQLPEVPDPTRAARMKWWRQARLGMFVHYGPYAVLGRGEWAMQQEHIKPEEYTTYGDQLLTTPGSVERWVLLAAQSGCKYMVLTAKHCDGYCLWGSSQTDFNAVKRGPRRDLVREYVETCRSLGIKVGIYYGLMDWRHPDGDRCAIDEKARKRFVKFTHDNVLELMSNYGPIDILWFDGPWPMPTPEQWESAELIAKVRKLQPQIIINNRARVAEDFSTPEGHITPADGSRNWEACMTLNGDWGYADTPAGDYRSTRDILRLLRQVTAFGGNLLLNVGPKGMGQVPEPSAERLKAVGKWLDVHGEAVYGDIVRVPGIIEPWVNSGYWTLKKSETGKGYIGYYFLLRGDPHGSFSIAGLSPNPKRVTLMHTGQEIRVTPYGHRLRVEAVPELASEPSAGSPVLRFEFDSKPHQQIGAGMMTLPDDKCAWW